MAMTLVSTVTVGSGGAASIEFTNIPQTGKDLVILYSLRVTTSGTVDSSTLRFNGSNTSFTNRYLYGLGSSVGTNAGSDSNVVLGNASSSTSNTFTNCMITIPNYTGSTNKSFSIDETLENNATTGVQGIYAGLWSNTSAITSLSFTKASDTYVQYSTASLYIIS